MGSSSFYDDPTDYQVIDASTAGSSFYGEGPGYAQVDPDGIKHLKDLAEAAAVAAEASNVSAAAHDASSALHDASATAHDISAAAHDASAALHDSNAEASASAAATSEGNAYVSASNAHASDVSSAANAAIATAQAGIATTKASQASTSETNAATSETNSHTSEVNAAASASAAAATLAGALTKANNLSDLTNVGTAKTNLGLNNVDNTSDVNKPVSTAQATAIGLRVPLTYLDTDTALTANSDTKIATQKATKSAIAAAIDGLINSAPGALDTLNELAASLGNDPNFATTVTNALALKLAISNNLSDLQSASTALTNLGLSANAKSLVTAANYAAMKTLLAITSNDVGLGNVTNVAQMPLSYLDTDVTLTANSDTKVASQKAVKAYIASNGGGGGGRVLLNTLTASGSSSLDDTSSLTSTYSSYEIVLEDIVPGTASQDLRLLVRSGGTFQTSSYLGSIFAINTAGPSTSTQGSTVCIPLTVVGGNFSNRLSGALRITSPSGTSGPKMVYGQTASPNAANNNAMLHTVGGFWNGSAAIDGVRLIMSSGVITSGKMKVYGLN